MAVQNGVINKAKAITSNRNNLSLLENYTKEQETIKKAQEIEQEINNASVLNRSLSTMGDITFNLWKGLGKGLEGIVDIGASLIGGIGGIFDKNFKQKVKDFVATDYVGGFMDEKLGKYVQNSYLKEGGIIEGVAQGVGQMLPAVLVTVATGGAGAGTLATQAASLGTMAVSAAGTSTEQAYQEGADYYKGLGYGIASGVVEAATEKMFGGVTKGLVGAGVLDNVTGKVAKTGIKRVAKNAIEEGIEEAVSEAVNPALQSIYKGTEAFEEYKSPEFLKNVGQSALIGGLTSVAYGGTVGYGLQKLGKGYVGKKADIADSLTSIQELRTQMTEYQNEGKLSQNEGKITEAIKKNYQNIEKVLEKASPEKRADYIKEFDLSNAFTQDGKISPTLSNMLGVTQSTEQGGKTPTIANKDYYSVNLRGSEQTIVDDLANMSKERQADIKVYDGNLTDSEQQNFTQMKKGLSALNKLGKSNLDFVLVDTDSINASIVDNKRVYISKKSLESGQWAKDIVHEYTHFAEGTQEYAKLYNYLTEDSELFNKSLDSVVANYGINKDEIQAITNKLQTSDALTDSEKRTYNLVRSEIGAKMTETMLGNQQFIDKIVAKDSGLVKRIVNKINELKELLKNINNKSARQEYARLQKAGNLYIGAVKKSGNAELLRWIEKNIGGKEEQKETKYSISNEYTYDTLKKLEEEYRESSKKEKILQSNLNSITGYQEQVDKLYKILADKTVSNEVIDKAIAEYKNWEQESGYAEAYNEYNKERDRNQEISNRIDDIKNKLSKSLNEESFSQEEIDKFVQKAIRKYHTTPSLRKASYLLTTGSMLDFSEGQGYRVKDHREISEILDLPDYAEYSSGMIMFMNMGNIRLQTYGIDIATMPNSKQISSLRGIIQNIMNEYDEFTVDFSKKNGDSAGSVVYPKGVSSSRIITDIKSYFETGILPEEPSEISKFRFSLPETDSNGNKLTAEQREFFRDSKVVDEQGRLQVMYRGGNEDITVFDKKKTSYANLYGRGFYFTFDKSIASQYGQVKEYYLNIQNPLMPNQNNITKSQKRAFLQEVANNEDYTLDNYGEYATVESVLKELNNKGDFETIQDINATCIGDMVEAIKLFNKINNTNYDGIILETETVVFGSNQIKLTTNKTPTQNEDIRYSLPNKQPSDMRQLTRGEYYKLIANNTQFKKYNKSESQAVIQSIVDEILSEKSATLKGKKKSEAIEMLWQKLNMANRKQGEGLTLADQLAEYILANAVVEDMYKDEYIAENQYILDTLSYYKGKINLSTIKSDIESYYGKNSSEYRIWNTKKGNIGQSVNQIAQELENSGLSIDTEGSQQNIFFQIADMYNNAQQNIDTARQTARELLQSSITTEERKALKQRIIKDILNKIDTIGNKTKFAELVEKATNNEKSWKQSYYDLKQREKALRNLFESVDKVKGLEKYKSADTELPEEVLGFIKLLKGIKTYRGNLSKNIRKIMKKYGEEINGRRLFDLIAETQEGEKNIFQERIDSIARGNGELTTSEIIALDEILRNFIHNVNNYNKVFFENKRQDTLPLAVQGVKETQEMKKATDSAFIQFFKKLDEPLKSPYNRFERLSAYRKDGIMSKMYAELQKGFDKQAHFQMIVAEHYKEFFKQHKKEVNKWYEPTYEIDGVKLSIGQKIGLYLTSLREQGRSHLYGNGYVKITNEQVTKKQGLVDGEIQGKDIAVNEELIKKIEDSFTETEKKFIDLTQDFFNRISKEAKKTTDMELYGVTNIVEDNYYPLRVEKDSIYTKLGNNTFGFNDLFNVFNPSFNKDTVKGAKNKLIIENVLDVINRHTRQMAVYYGMSRPLKTFNRLYNMPIETPTGKTTLRRAIKEVDTRFERYANTLFNDIQGNTVQKTGISKAMSKLRGWGAKAALGANLKVLTTQFVSLPAAAAVGFKYGNLAKGMAMAISKKTNVAKMFEFAPMLYDRFRNGNNIDVGLLKENQGILGQIDWLTDLTTAPIGAIDSFVCMSIWNAAVEQTKGSKSYADYSDEHYKKAAQMTEAALIRTQANYAPLYRPEILRSQDSLVQTLTMFMSEPLQQYTLIFGSIDKLFVTRRLAKNNPNNQEYQDLYKQAKKESIRALSAVLLDTILLTAIAQLFKWVKGKEDEDKVKGIIGDFADNYIGMFPIVKDIYNYMVNGYEISNMTYTGLTNIADGITGLYNLIDVLASGKAYDESMIRSKLRSVVLGISQALGIPLRNFETYVKGLIGKVVPEWQYTYEDYFYKKSTSQYAKDINSAIEKGDNKLADTIIGLMLDETAEGLDSETVRQSLRELMEAGYNVLPKSIGDSITINGETHELTKKEQNSFEKVYAEANSVVQNVVKLNSYKNMTTEQKAQAIKFIYNTYYNKAVDKVFGLDTANKNVLFAQAIPLEKLAVIVAMVNSMSADVDKNGNTIAGTLKAKIQKYVSSLNLTATQKYMVMGYLGYKNTYGETQVKAYINTLGLDKEDREYLLEKSGY